MLIVLPVCSKDALLAARNVEHLLTLEGRCDFACLLTHERGFEADASLVFDLATRYFSSVTTYIYDPWKGDGSWPHPQNWAFSNTARWIEAQRKWPCFFWWEADATPLKADVFSTLASAYTLGARPFAGPISTHMGVTYVAGVAIYPSAISRYIPTALLARAQPWDIVASARDGAIRHAHDISPLITHDPASINGTHFDSSDDIARLIPDTAVLYHKCKDGSLLDVLQGKVALSGESPNASSNALPPRLVVPSFTEQTSWDCGYFTFPVATNTAYYNCSLAERDGSLYLFTRRERRHLEQTTGGMEQGNRNDLAIWRLRPNMSVESTPILPACPKRYPLEQWEDPRVITGEDGSAYVAFSTWVHHQKWSIRQSFTRLSRDWRHVEPLWESPYGGNTRKPELNRTHEKNWIWFQHDSQWHCQYSINPGDYFRVDASGNPVQVWKSKEVSLSWQHGLPLRGGTPPTRVGDEYIAFFHTSITWQKPKRRYFMGAYTFDAAPPFTLRRMTLNPLLTGSEHDHRAWGGPLVIFPNGALLRNDVWTITFGVNDEACGWIRIPHADLEEQLVYVNRKSVGERLLEAFT